MRCSLIVLVCLLSAASLGCKAVNDRASDMSSWTDKLIFFKPKRKAEPPAKVAVIWTDTVLSMAGKTPTRGFGGRIYFYNRQNQAIPVEGELVINAFDDSLGAFDDSRGAYDDSRGGDGQPDRQFVFTSEQLARHYGETELGPSYSIWIPWDRVGGRRKEISLLPLFTSTDGQLVTGNMSPNVLPGVKNSADGRTFENAPASYGASSSSSDVRPVGYQQPSQGRPQSAPATMRTTTINVPRELSQRMARSASSTYWNPSPRPSTTYASQQNPGWQNQTLPSQTVPSATTHSDTLARAAATAMSPAQPESPERSARFGRPRPRAQRAPIGRLTRADGRWQPRPEAPPSALPFAPQSYHDRR